MNRIDNLIKESKKVFEALPEVSKYNGPDWSGFELRYTVPGDSLSDYEYSVIVKASNQQDAINRLKRDARLVGFDPSQGHISSFVRPIPSILNFKKQSPNSNIPVLA